MGENLTLALLITLIGMGLVFAAILLLWGMMALLVKVTTNRNLAEREERARELKLKQSAAAAAVALALALEDSQPHEFPLPPTAIVSAWQAVMRTKMLNKRGSVR